MTNHKTNAIPEGIHIITPHIVVRDAAQIAEWYKTAFGAVEKGTQIGVPGGKFMHIEIWIGDSAIMMADEFLEMNVLSPLSLGGSPIVLAITTNNVDALWERAVAAGAEVFHPLGDMFWGDHQGQLVDPSGHHWNLIQHVQDVSPEEITAAAAKMFGQQA